MKKMLTVVSAMLVAPLFVLLSYMLVLSSVQAQVNDVAIQQISGVLSRIDGTRFYIQTSDGVKEALIPSGVEIQRDGGIVSLSSIQPGDKVELEATMDGQVLSIEATSPARQNLRKYIIGIAVALILGLIIYVLMRRSNHTSPPTHDTPTE